MKIRIYYEDTDAGGIVYHANYIKFCERARSEYCFNQNIMPGFGDEYGFVVRHIDADYYAPSILGDILKVKSTVSEIKNSSFILLQEIHKDEQKIFSMRVVLVYVEKGKSVSIPAYFRDLLSDI